MFRSGSSLFGLTAMLLGLVAATLASIVLMTSWSLQRSFDVIARAVILDDLGEYEVIYNREGIEGVRALFSAGSHDKDHILRVLSPSGDTAVEVLTTAQPHLQWPDMPGPPLKPHQTKLDMISLKDGTTLTVGRRRLADGTELWFGRTNVDDLAAIHDIRRLMLVSAGLTALLAIGPILWFTNRVLRPVRRLIDSAHHLADGDSMKTRLQSSKAIPELTEFAEAFNSSLDRVQVLTEELEAANDQLAHELRTPLARIRGNVEAVLREHQMGADIEGAVAHTLEEVDRAALLVQSILSIRAGDARTMKLQREMTSAQQLVTEICELYTAAAEERGLTLEFFVTGGDCWLLMDRQRIQQALANYLDNALAYTPSGGVVSVHLEIEAHEIVIRVCDTGPGLKDIDPSRIWKRFARGSAASASAPGIGLGLSLVRAIAHAHRGSTGCQNRSGMKGAEFWIRLPILR